MLLFCLTAALRAADLPTPITLDLPVPADRATPAWLGHPDTPATTFATLALPIQTPDPTASLLVTVYFTEKQDGFLRITWQGIQGPQILSNNFYEAIGMANQRSLLISPATLVGDGTLLFQTGDSTLGVQRIKLEWLGNTNALVSPLVQDLLVTPAVGPTERAPDLNGQSAPTQPGAWQGQIVTVPVTDQAERIEQGVEFSVDLDSVPGAARLALKEAGLPLGKHLVVWVNEQRAGTISPNVPDLQDGGYLADASAATTYAGWRDGSFFVPPSLLKAGVNTLQLSDENDSGSGTAQTAPSASGEPLPLAVKGMVLQLNYTSNTATASQPDLPQPHLSPTITLTDPIPSPSPITTTP
jgi:hypothetical protein